MEIPSIVKEHAGPYPKTDRKGKMATQAEDGHVQSGTMNIGVKALNRGSGKRIKRIKKKEYDLPEERVISFLNSFLSFHSKEDLLKINKDRQFSAIMEQINDQQDFIKILDHCLFSNNDIDFSLFQSAKTISFYEPRFKIPIKTIELENLEGISIWAADGGMAAESFLGFNVDMIKVAIIQFTISNGRGNIDIVRPEDGNEGEFLMHINPTGQSSGNFQIMAGLKRELAEIGMIVKNIYYRIKYKKSGELPDIILLDGSIMPPPLTPQIRADKSLKKLHEMLVETYFLLYELSFKYNIHVVGSIKDSNSQQLLSLIARSLPFFISRYGQKLSIIQQIKYRELLNTFIDTDLLFRILDVGTRTPLFDINPLKTNKNNLPADESDYGEGINNISVNHPYSYLQKFEGIDPITGKFIPVAAYSLLTPHDIPLRQEFILPRTDIRKMKRKLQEINELISIFASITPKNGKLSLPLPQVEAHLRAKMNLNEFKLITETFKRKLLISRIKLIEQIYDENNKNISNPNIEILRKIFGDNNLKSGDFKRNMLSLMVRSYNGMFYRKRHDLLDKIF